MSQPCPRCGVDLTEEANFCVGCGADLREDAGEFHFKPPDPLVGQVVADRYHILELVGRGGMGVVYKVEHIRMGKLMAMKLLHGELARDREVVKRFKREATAVSRLSHPNTVQVFDFGRSEGLMYLIMEFIEGVELARLVRRQGPISFPRCAAIVSQVCSSLSEAHEQGIIHRDLKPENVLLRNLSGHQELVKVLDFGLVKLRETDERADTTSQGVLVGTPHYMSPEQIRGEEVDHRSDIYSLGAMMYKVLTGVPPFPASTPVAVLTKHLNEPPPRICERFSELGLSEAADDIIGRCLEKEAEHRYQSVEEIRQTLLAELSSTGAEGLVPSESSMTVRSRPRVTEDAPEEPETPTGAMRVGRRLIEIGSRGEFDRLERSLLIRRVLSWISAVVAALVVIVVVVGLVAARFELELAVRAQHLLFAPAERDEREPNDQPAEAERLWSGTLVRGTVGQRVSLTESDRDWFLIRKEGEGPQGLRASLTPVPRMDLILQAITFDVSGSRVIAEANEGGPGEGEEISGAILDEPDVYLLVREEWLAGRPPTENVSDHYELQVDLLDPAAAQDETSPRASSHR